VTERPPLMHLGDALRWFRHRHSLTQAETGTRMGMNPSSAQRLVSMRELPLGAPDYIAATAAELVNLEDATGVARGTILRHAGYVDSTPNELPADLDVRTLEIIQNIISIDRKHQAAVEIRPQRARRKGPIQPRVAPDES
jgi:transcriptional regulator with XRE-family HTH domain